MSARRLKHQRKPSRLRLIALPDAGKMCTIVVSQLCHIILCPAWWMFRKMLFASDAFVRHHGIVIAEFGPQEALDPFFVSRTKETLDYIAGIDRRRFNRIECSIKAIVRSRPCVSYGGRFQRGIRACLVNTAALPYDTNPADAKRMYACILVHEATHAMLEHRGIPDSTFMRKATKMRVERICDEEEIRLSRRFEDGLTGNWEKLIRNRLRF